MNRTVIVAVDDMLFASKIRAAAEHLTVNVRFVRGAEAVVSAAREKTADLIIVDLQSQKIDAIELAKKFRSDAELRSIPLLGFLSHVLTDLQRQAKEAGYTHVMPRSVFSNKLSEILKGESKDAV
jgi:CheY-like chemotaxis protein